MTRFNQSSSTLLTRQILVRGSFILGAFYLAFQLGRRSQTMQMSAIVPILFFPLVVIGLRNPVLLVQAFPIVFFAANSDWRFMGLSSLELVGFSMVGLAALRVVLRRHPLPHSNLYFPIFLYSLFLIVFLLMFPEHIGTQRLWGNILRGLALYLGAAVFIRNRRDVTRFVVAMAMACLILLARMIFTALTLPLFDPQLWGRGYVNQVLANFTTWQLNQMAPVLLLCAWLLPDARLRRLSALGFLAASVLNVISLTRAGIVDLALVLLLAAPYLFSRRLSAPGRVLILLPLAFTWVYSAITDFNVIGHLWGRLVRDFNAGTSRVDFFLSGWEVFLRYPLTGGLIPLGFSPGAGHSYWGNIVRDYGLPFLLVNLALIALIARDAYLLSRRSDDPILSTVGKGMLIGTLVAPWQMFHDSVLHTQSYAMIFWLLRGVTTACLNMPDEPDNRE